MSWVRLDDGYDEHSKIEEVGPLALAAHVSGMCYAARNLTDGFLPAGRIPKLVNLADFNVTHQNLADSLVAAGLWHRAGELAACDRCGAHSFPVLVPTGYVIHDYLLYNPSRAEVESSKAQKAAAGKIGGSRRAVAAKTETEQRATTRDLEGQARSSMVTDTRADTPPAGHAPSAESPSSATAKPASRKQADVPKLTQAQRELWWNTYPAREGVKKGKRLAMDQLDKVVKPGEFNDLMKATRNLAASGELPPDAFRWLRLRDWTEWIDWKPAAKGASPAKASYNDVDDLAQQLDRERFEAFE